ncbi:MAG: carboxypeptidase-like regulatory domain-containing protein [Cyclobacteriaceae bacterium]
MKRLINASLALLLTTSLVFGQKTQLVKGRVIDGDSQMPLIGATVYYYDQDSVQKGGVTDIDGFYQLPDAPVGRQIIYASYFGYNPWTSGYQEITTGKEVVLNINMIESVVNMDAVTVSAEKLNTEANNEFSVISVRSFDVEETQRYAGSLNDVGRMAMSLPGVQFSQQDNENTMVIRANSPMGVLWRLEGVDIANPNHFADRFTGGGGISALSINVMGGSDFATGAFAPEYGNALAGVMDLKFRKGNTSNRESRFQIGLIGIDLATEGPIKENEGSYLVNYRYSTLGILAAMGIRVVQPNVSNTFQDLSFNVYHRIGSKTFLNVFGFGGISKERRDHIEVEDVNDWEFYRDSWEYAFDTYTGAMGISMTNLLKNDAYIKTVVSASAINVFWNQNWHHPNYLEKIEENYLDGRFIVNTKYHKKIKPGYVMDAGIQLSRKFYDVRYDSYDPLLGPTGSPIVDNADHTYLAQPYLQFKQTFSSNFNLLYGLHSMYYALNNEFSLEPRVALQYQPRTNYIATLAVGKHSQTMPFALEEANIGNNDLLLPKAYHVVLGQDFYFKNNFHVKVEPYFQRLFHVPVSQDITSSYWSLNQEDNLTVQQLVSEGLGMNYGADLTIEKFFSNHIFFLMSGSGYKSVYNMNNGGFTQWFSTRYNSNYNGSVMVGKEWPLKNDRAIEFTTRFLAAGGLRYTPINERLSILAQSPVEEQDRAFELQNDPYSRLDIRLAYRKNNPKTSWKVSLDIQNTTVNQNFKRPYFDYLTTQIRFEEQAGLVPVISYTLDF